MDVNGNWQKVYEANLEVQPSPVPNRYYPIPSFTINQSFTGDIVIGALNPNAKLTWRLAFYASQIVTVYGIGGTEISNMCIPLGASLLSLKEEVPSYKLKISIPKWHQRMDIEIWQYVGPTN